jgi:hypothetical protein
MVVEVVSYNPNYKMFIWTKIEFIYDSSGLVRAHPSSKAFSLDVYKTSTDYVRACLELIFSVYIIYQVG